MLGVDEFALRRGKKFGTILNNLEDGTPVDLLPDHQAANLAGWLKQHPGVQLLSLAPDQGLMDLQRDAERINDCTFC